MKASELIGKMALRTKALSADTYDCRADYYTTRPIEIVNVTDSHLYYRIPEATVNALYLTRGQKHDPHEVFVMLLDSDELKENWAPYEPTTPDLMKQIQVSLHIDTSDVVTALDGMKAKIIEAIEAAHKMGRPLS